MNTVLKRTVLSFAVLASANCASTTNDVTIPQGDGGPSDASMAVDSGGNSPVDSSPPDTGEVDTGASSTPDATGGATDGAGDDGTVDAPGNTGDGAVASTGLFSDDFESGSVDATKWTQQTMNGATVQIQTMIVAHGKYAAHFHSPGPGAGSPNDYAYLIASNAPAPLATHNFGRAYFYANPRMTSVDTGLIWGGTKGFPRPTYLSLAAHNGGWQFGFIQLMGSPGGEVQAYPATPMPVATWTCIEWEFNDQPTTIKVWGDGTEIGTLDNTDIAYPPGHTPGTPLFNNMNSGLIGAFTDFGFGFYDWHPGGFAFDYYYDDIVLDTMRVGCLNSADK